MTSAVPATPHTLPPQSTLGRRTCADSLEGQLDTVFILRGRLLLIEELEATFGRRNRGLGRMPVLFFKACDKSLVVQGEVVMSPTSLCSTPTPFQVLKK